MPGVALRGAVARGCLVVLCLVAFVDAKGAAAPVAARSARLPAARCTERRR